MIISGLFHVAIKTNDLEATRAFYCDVLGLKEVFRPDFGYRGRGLRVRFLAARQSFTSTLVGRRWGQMGAHRSARGRLITSR